jgi:trk system potassium uptake protein TrkH
MRNKYWPFIRQKVLRVPHITSWRIPLTEPEETKTGGISPFLIIVGFAGIIALGTVLLMFPVATVTAKEAPFIDALFTSTSAVCVTGLVIVDTGTYWSPFGQVVILILIQAGGFGFMTSATLVLLALGRKMGLRYKLLIGDSMGIRKMRGLDRLLIRIAIFTIAAELIGAAIFYICFYNGGESGNIAWKALFHSISAFNNAGFDIFGDFRSLTGFQQDAPVLITTALLIFLGGISYIVVADVIKSRRFERLTLDSKIVLTTTIVLLGLGMIMLLLTEFSNADTLGPLSLPYKLLNAFFQSVTPRTAGFNTIDIHHIADYSLFFIILLMFVGGASGSTAGGVKVNTFGMLIATMWSTLRGKERAGAFGRTFMVQQVYRALTVVMLSLTIVSVVVFILTVVEEFDFLPLLFETFSAFGTVGLTTGITPGLSDAGRAIITGTMFIGRLGPLALMFALVQEQQPIAYSYPEEEVRTG